MVLSDIALESFLIAGHEILSKIGATLLIPARTNVTRAVAFVLADVASGLAEAPRQKFPEKRTDEQTNKHCEYNPTDDVHWRAFSGSGAVRHVANDEPVRTVILEFCLQNQKRARATAQPPVMRRKSVTVFITAVHWRAQTRRRTRRDQ